MTWQLAQLNIALPLEPLDSDRLAGFVAALEPVNALAEVSPGFVWRLKTEDGDATAVRGFGDDRLKQWNCRRILELADGFGVRTVAKGVETRADFVMARELGFDLIQGFFFAKPMEARKFSRKILGRHLEMPK